MEPTYINIKEVIDKYFGFISKLGIVLVIVSTFFLFTSLTTEFYDTPKFLVLLVVTSILLLLISARFTILGKVVFLRTPLDIPILLLVAVGVVSTFLSSSFYVALLGNQLRIHTSLISWILYAIFYFVLINSLKTIKEVKWVVYISTLAAAVLSVVTLLFYAGIKLLPPPWTYGINFTPTGSDFSTTAVLALLVPIVVMQILTASKPLFTILNSLFLALFGVTIALTGTWATWIAALAGLALMLFISGFFDKVVQGSLRDIKTQIALVALVIPILLVILITTLSYIPPIGGVKNPLYTQAQNFSREKQLPFNTSWKISISAFRDSPFWGTSPSSYLFNFTNYKPIELNATPYWNIRFDNAFNEYLQVLATLGGIGLLALLSLTALFISSASTSLRSNNDLLKTSLAVSGLLFFIILVLHPSSMVLWIFAVILLASFMVINHSQDTSRVNNFANIKEVLSIITSRDSSTATIRVDALPSVLLTIFLFLVIATFFFAGKLTLADFRHRNALNAIAQNQGIIAYNELIAAEQLNPVNDVYRTDLAQVNFALANAIAAAKAPSEASPGGSLTDQDKQNIQVLLQQSINEGRMATNLNPKSAINWEVLATLYRQIAGVAENALLFSLDSYGRAIQNDPLNPQLRLNVGGVYYAVQSFDLAIRFFTDAVNLKPDLANGYYNLSVALRDKGDLAGAQQVGQKVLELITDQNSNDYKTAQRYLEDLKSKLQSGAGTTGSEVTQPPAAQTSGALQNEELPKVIDLEKPEKIATPAAVKKPNTTPEPNPTSTP